MSALTSSTCSPSNIPTQQTTFPESAVFGEDEPEEGDEVISSESLLNQMEIEEEEDNDEELYCRG